LPAGYLRLPSSQETGANMAGHTSGNVDGGIRMVDDFDDDDDDDDDARS